MNDRIKLAVYLVFIGFSPNRLRFGFSGSFLKLDQGRNICINFIGGFRNSAEADSPKIFPIRSCIKFYSNLAIFEIYALYF